MKPIRFHPEAEAEMIAAAKYYENQQSHLGRRFLASVRESLAKIPFDPDLYPKIDSNTRRCLTRIFPYAILYRVKDQSIEILGVMHLHRKPNYWKQRLKSK